MWFRIRVFFDIFIVSAIIYRVLVLVAGTRAIQLVKGFLILGTFTLLTSALELKLVSWFLSQIVWALVFAIPIVFQPELRKMLEEIGRGNLWDRRMNLEQAENLSREIVAALGYMKANKIGALLVLQQETGLKDYWRTAVKLDAKISQELIISLFWKNNPLHDGAVIMDRNDIIAAGCYLPLTDNPNISRWYGTRHRAALGITDVSDAMALVVSEERGEVALAYNGHLSKNLKDAQLQKLLLFYFSGTREITHKTLKDRLLKLLRPLWSK
ncbi:MAG: diadenylate cyclase CdaA [Synergistaceae bacterium]|jgi:diadenylate cyclase|nr:diadenylate cyclase CdaA [Synergistaceae bacterium]